MTTLADLRIHAAREIAAGLNGACTGAGTTTTLVDAALADVYQDTKALNNAWVYRPDAAAADQMRRVGIDGFGVSTGTLTVTRDWATPPIDTEAYEIYPFLPPFDHAGVPSSWLRIINAALRRCWFVDNIVLGRGDDRGGKRFYFAPGEVSLFAIVAVEGGTGITITPPSGWTLVLRTDDGTTLSLALYTKRARVDDPLSWSWGLTSCVAGGVIVAVADPETGSPVDVSAGAANGSSATATAPTATTTVADTLLLRLYASALAGAMVPTSPQREVYDLGVQKPAAGTGLIVATTDQPDVDAAGTAEATMGSASASIGMTVAIAPKDSDARAAVVGATGGHNGAGDTALVLFRPSSVASDDWTPTEDTLMAVLKRQRQDETRYEDLDQDRNGGDWYWLDNPKGVEVLHIPGVDDEVIARVARYWPSLSAETDETDVPIDLATSAIRFELYRYLNGAAPSAGTYQSELVAADRDFRVALENHKIRGVVRGL